MFSMVFASSNILYLIFNLNWDVNRSGHAPKFKNFSASYIDNQGLVHGE